MTVAEALRDASRRLAPVSDTARLDAEILMTHALGAARSDMLLHQMQAAVPASFDGLIGRRERHEPVAYITGRQEFYGLDLEVTPAVLIPRADSETLIEAAREAFAERAPKRILDLGTGSGALLLAALTVWPDAEGIGIDHSEVALTIAAANAQRLGLAERARLLNRDWAGPGWADDLGRLDLIVANPPYVETHAELSSSIIEYEPAGALFAGPEGLDDYRVLIPQLPGLLAENGVAVLEIGASQADQVSDIARQSGFVAELRRDLAERPRALVLRLGLGKERASHYLSAQASGGEAKAGTGP